jgi:aminopeptidase N
MQLHYWCVGALAVLGGTTAGAAPAFVVERYEVELRIDAEAKRIDGSERLRVRSEASGLDVLHFPLNGLDVSSVRDRDKKNLAFAASGETLEIPLRKPLARNGKTTIDVDYVARAPRGVVFDPGPTIYTIFSTCHWMVCREEPGERASFTVSLIVPTGTTVVAGGEPEATTAITKTLERHTWSQREPYPTYLFGFAFGPLQQARDGKRPTELLYYGAATPSSLQELFAPTRAMLEFFRERAGVRFPHPAYRQVMVDGDAAQELSTLSIVGRNGLEARLEDPHEDWLIAHELCHQYWGNLLTCADWTHFWLNEGLTTFMVAAWKEQRWGRDAYDRELALCRERRARATAAGFDVPLTFAGDYPSLRIKRAVVYSKGALFLAALRETLGDRVFWSALRRYTRRFAGRSVTSRDFQQIFERESKRDLSALFGEWVYGRP